MASKYFAFTIFFIKIIAISCKRYGSLSLVIDDTKSMAVEIDSVKDESIKFMDIILTHNSSQISDVVIVTFNDPVKSTLRLNSTIDKDEVKEALNKIHVHGGGDYPEYSLAGINTALDNSLQNSYLFVFTDASPKDGYVRKRFSSRWIVNRTLQAKEIAGVNKHAQDKETQIFFFVTKDHRRIPQPEILFQPYWDIAAATNGQVFKINKKEDLGQFLKYMNIIISGEANVMTRKEIKAGQRASISFSVDKQTQYVLVSASSRGEDIILDITSGPTRSYKKTAWTKNNKILNIINPIPGNYTALVEGSGDTTIMVVGRTDFSFQHGFSKTIPPTFSNENLQPIKGKEIHLLVKVYDPTKNFDIETVQITSPDEKTIYYSSLALKKVFDGYYATEQFSAPNDIFIITVIGEDKLTEETIKRTAKTPVQPRSMNTEQPQANLLVNNKTSIPFEYLSTEETLFTCHVISHSRPVIVWKNGKNEVVTISGDVTKNNDYEYTTEIKMSQFRKSETFYCEAKNEISTTKSNIVYIDVSDPFRKVSTGLDNNINNINNGEKIVIPCGIASDFLFKITWYKLSTGEVLQTSDRYLITENGAVLTIRNVDLSTRGKYRCKASIVGDEATQKTHDTTVDLNLEKPEIETKHHDLEVFRDQKALLKCKFLKGFPRPSITWLVKYEETSEFVVLPEIGEELIVWPALYRNTGVYKCVLKNLIGSDEGTVKLVVKGPPVILTDNEIVYTAAFGDDVLVIPCDVAGYPKPNITWAPEFSSETKFDVDSNGSLVIKNPTIDVSDRKFVCTATNGYGYAQKDFKIVVNGYTDNLAAEASS